MRTNPSARRGERGVTLVIMALLLSLVLGMSALAIDYGMIKSAKAEAQRAMDAAALAGAAAFLPDPATGEGGPPVADGSTESDDSETAALAMAIEWAKDYGAKNTVGRFQINRNDVIVVPAGLSGITATYTSPPLPLGFGNIFQSGPIRVRASATAEVTAVDTVLRLVK